MSSTAMQPVQAGDYRLVAKLGAGGMGDVYLGVSPTADRVAVKIVKPDLVGEEVRQRFADEVEHLRTVFGARVARFEGADLDAAPAWLATEYVPGLTLKQYVDRHQPLPLPLASMVGAMLAEGLAKVHDSGLLHRDLKPHNVIMGPSGPVLIDFGVATLREGEGGLTEPGQLVGTPAFMAPEQARGGGGLTEQVDVYGLGATLVYALTGRTVYPGVGGWALVMRIAAPDHLPDLGGVPVELEPLLTAMLANDPAARLNLRAVGWELLQVASGGVGQPDERRRRLLTVRREVAELTYDETVEVTISGALADPVRDPEATAASVEPSPEPTEAARSAPEPGQAPAPGPRADVTWLVEQLRRQYARRAAL